MYLSLDIGIEKGNKVFNEIVEKLDLADIQTEKMGWEILNIHKSVMYWRKANAIHNWFVQKFAFEGEDNCQPLWISKESMADEFRRDLLMALANPERTYELQNPITKYALDDFLAKNPIDEKTYENPMPPQEGFFFGSTNLDDYYYSTIEDTYAEITTLLNKLDDKGNDRVSFIYQASW